MYLMRLKCDQDVVFSGKEIPCWDLLLGCIDLWVSCEWDDPDYTDIMESNTWSYWGPFGWFWGLKELIRACQMDLPCHIWLWGFTAVVWQVQVSGC